MTEFKETYLNVYMDNFRFLDPECHDARVREVNMQTKRCNRCQGFEECKRHPHFWLFGDPVRLAENETMPDSFEKAVKVAHRALYQKTAPMQPPVAVVEEEE